MDDCIFCKITQGNAPCYKILEDQNFIAFLDIRPFSSGHTLVIPKTHYRWTYDVPNFGDYWEFTKKCTQILQEKLKPDFITYLTMGNQVPHAHIHIIPRHYHDNLTDLYNEEQRLSLSPVTLDEVINKINL